MAFDFAIVLASGAFLRNARAAQDDEIKLKTAPATLNGAIDFAAANCLRARESQRDELNRSDDLAALNAELTQRIEALAASETGAGASP